jgi:hypothetical protein
MTPGLTMRPTGLGHGIYASVMASIMTPLISVGSAAVGRSVASTSARASAMLSDSSGRCTASC